MLIIIKQLKMYPFPEWEINIFHFSIKISETYILLVPLKNREVQVSQYGVIVNSLVKENLMEIRELLTRGTRTYGKHMF